MREPAITPAPTDVLRSSIASGVLLAVLAFGTVACGGESGGEGGNETMQEEASGVERYALPGEEIFPEGIAYRPGTGDFFVGSTTDGTIYRGNVEGDSKQTEVFLEPGGDGRRTAVGMDVDREGRLFIAGGDLGMIFVYDAKSGIWSVV